MRERKELMHRIYVVGFALDEIVLFLDTHPQDEQAFSYYETLQNQYQELRGEYIAMFGPLSQFDVISGRPCSCNDSRYRRATWSWGEAPMPWEGGC